MHKIWSLYQNEMIKVSRRKLIWVMGIILVALLLLINMGMKMLYNNDVSSETNTEEAWQNQQLMDQQNLDEIRSQIESGYSYSGEVLLPSQIEELEQEAAVLEYKQSSNYYQRCEGQSGSKNLFVNVLWTLMLNIDRTILFIFCVLIAGTAVSSEISSGSIKSLIIAPVKRWKIFLAKSFMILTMLILGTLFSYGVSALLQGAFFGFDAGLPVVRMAGSAVVETPLFAFMLEHLVLSMFDILVICVFALMLSAVIRSSAASVAISMGVYFIVTDVVRIISMLIDKWWVKYIPFVNFNIQNRILGSASSEIEQILGTGQAASAGTPSVAFSLIYLCVLTIGMYYIAWDSFCRRDIKK